MISIRTEQQDSEYSIANCVHSVLQNSTMSISRVGCLLFYFQVSPVHVHRLTWLRLGANLGTARIIERHRRVRINVFILNELLHIERKNRQDPREPSSPSRPMFCDPLCLLLSRKRRGNTWPLHSNLLLTFCLPLFASASPGVCCLFKCTRF
jgi:hypothetical protein